jgi:hypothetical protein
MGVLDDAIREHLELRRSHGVPEEELRRQAEEALGPTRREVAPEEEDGTPAADGELAEAEHAEAEAEHAEPAAEAAQPEPAAEAPAEPAAGEPDHTDTLGQPTEEHAVEELEFGDDDEPELSETLPADAVRSDVHDETLDPDEAPERDFDELDEEEVLDDDELEEDDLDDEDLPAEDGDVLEDTPEFLQETPEHDRLWFEQKPPRDFDFD